MSRIPKHPLETEPAGCLSEACAGDLYSAQRVRELLDGVVCLPGFDIDRDLADAYPPVRRKNAEFILLAYILKAGADERAALLGEIRPDGFSGKFARFLFVQIQQHAGAEEGLAARLQADIEMCGWEVFGQDLNPTLRLTVYQWWFTTLATTPTREQFQRARAVLSAVDQEKSTERSSE